MITNNLTTAETVIHL